MGLCASVESEGRRPSGGGKRPVLKKEPGVVTKLLNTLDVGTTGRLLDTEIQNLLKTIAKQEGKERADEEIKSLIARMDTDTDGLMTIAEIKKLLLSQNTTDQTIEQVLKYLQLSLETKRKTESQERLAKIWADYHDTKTNQINKKLDDLLRAVGIDPGGPLSFAVPWKLELKHVGGISKVEFMSSMTRQGVNNLWEFSIWARRLRIQLKDLTEYKKLYTWMFDYLKEGSRKSIDKEVAIYVWNVVLSGRFHLLSKWTHFVQHNDTSIVVKKDLWQCLFDFAVEMSPDLSNYDRDAGAWPMAIDSFYDFVKAGGSVSDGNNNNDA